MRRTPNGFEFGAGLLSAGPLARFDKAAEASYVDWYIIHRQKNGHDADSAIYLSHKNISHYRLGHQWPVRTIAFQLHR